MIQSVQNKRSGGDDLATSLQDLLRERPAKASGCSRDKPDALIRLGHKFWFSVGAAIIRRYELTAVTAAEGM
jgi:hypothetical protein